MIRPWEYPGERVLRWAARWQSRYLDSRSYSDAERAGFWLGYRAGHLAGLARRRRLDTLDAEWSASTDHTESGPETLDGAPE